MQAIVVTTFDRPPEWQDIEAPRPSEGEVVVRMIAAALHPRVRSQASGSHYRSVGVLPLVPGVDGVARFPDGTTRYVAVDSDVRGSFAERVAVDPRASVVLPDGADPAEVAAAVNPVMSS